MPSVRWPYTTPTGGGDSHGREPYELDARAYAGICSGFFSAVDSADNILNFRRQTSFAKNPGAAALDLVYQAAELIGDARKFCSGTRSPRGITC